MATVFVYSIDRVARVGRGVAGLLTNQRRLLSAQPLEGRDEWLHQPISVYLPQCSEKLAVDSAVSLLRSHDGCNTMPSVRPPALDKDTGKYR